ncbi:MAG: permease [Firmicutes bacterium]|nr:permease [Bacillota bacterium]
MIEFLNANPILIMFIIAVLGYAIGRISIKGLSLGTAAVLLVALVFGHFGLEVPSLVKDIGLALFVTSIGFIAGPTFFRNFKGNAGAYVIMGILIKLTGVLICVAVKTDLAVGLLAGALTSTPALAAALEATGSNMTSIGYGIAYPFGVLGVVLFIQLVPKILHTDIKKERELITKISVEAPVENKKKKFSFDPLGYFGFALAIALGVLLGAIVIPLPGGLSFSLGTSGGCLITGLLIGHFGSTTRLNLTMKKETLTPLRELGLVFFLIGAGTKAGAGFIQVLQEQGVMLFVYGAIMTLIPMILGLFVARKVLKLGMFNSLGSICGGMTSTPALGTLIRTAETDDVTAAYAATYPIALAFMVLAIQIVVLIFK